MCDVVRGGPEDWLTVDRMSAPSEWVWGGVVLVVVLKWMVSLGLRVEVPSSGMSPESVDGVVCRCRWGSGGSPVARVVGGVSTGHGDRVAIVDLELWLLVVDGQGFQRWRVRETTSCDLLAFMARRLRNRASMACRSSGKVLKRGRFEARCAGGPFRQAA